MVWPDSVAESYEDDAEEEKLPVLRAQGVTLEDYDTTDDEYGYEYDSGYSEGYDVVNLEHKRRPRKKLKSFQ